jgi:hypothetical protein
VETSIQRSRHHPFCSSAHQMLIASSISDPSLPYHCKQHILWFYDRFAIVTLALSIPNTWCQVLQCVILRVALDPIWFCDRYDTTTCNCDISPFKVWNVVVYTLVYIFWCHLPGSDAVPLANWAPDFVTKWRWIRHATRKQWPQLWGWRWVCTENMDLQQVS